MTTFVFIFYDSSGPRHHSTVNPPIAGPFGVLMYSIFWMIITLPAIIVGYRWVQLFGSRNEQVADAGF